jgi:tRNA G18 (ribose-2'-O)-methylase SpoU
MIPRMEAAVDELVSDSHVELIGAVADPRAEHFDRAPRPERMAVVLGDEDQGIEPGWLGRCRRIVTIPMREGAGSLNVAVAAGILLHEFTRVLPTADASDNRATAPTPLT